ncbi:MAG: RraA family protein [Gemmatimonadetes bacterium]|nr:RraA family protein [Gemmatimonadota bacterium]
MTHTGKPGFRVLPSPSRLDAAILQRFAKLAASNLADAMGRFNFMDPGIQSRTGRSLRGPAVTVRCRPGDNLMVHKVLDVAVPGDVIVVNTCGSLTSAVFGGLMCHTAVAKQLGGIVVDGAVRDVEELRALGFPVFSRAVSPGACDKDGPGEINIPVACGGTVVASGDMVVGDADGVVVVPRADVLEVLKLVDELMDRERRRVAEIKAGEFTKPEIDDTLRKKGVIS